MILGGKMRNTLCKKGVALLILILFAVLSVLPLTGSRVIEKSSLLTSFGETLYVGGSGPGNYTSIQDAIDNATDGDTVFVYDENSPYYENVVVDKSIQFVGENRESTVIDGGGSRDVVNIKNDWVGINGFTIRNSGSNHSSRDAGVKVRSNNTDISNNVIISNNRYGIFLDSLSHDTTIFGNNISSNYNYGISIYYSSYNTISYNVINSNNHDGIWLDFSHNNTISNNIITSNNLDGIYLRSCNHNNIISGNDISSTETGIFFFLSNNSNNIILSNNISNNWIGIRFYRSNINNVISWNTINSNHQYGIYLDRCSNNTILNNTFVSNNWSGIYLESSNNITISHNAINSNQQHGIKFWNSTNVVISNNVIMSNQGNGIDLSYSDKNSVSTNALSLNEGGISLFQSSNIKIFNNIITNNNVSIFQKFCTSNKIDRNNFIDNQQNPLFRGCNNLSWDENYWNRRRFLPKAIFGTTGRFFGLIPWVNFDLHPAQEPYEILS